MNKTLFFLMVFFISVSCTKKPSENPKKQAQPVPVEIAIAEKKDIPVVLESFGQTSAIQSVSVTSKVSGKIEKIYFKEGQIVKKGALLVKIDSSQIEKSLEQAEAILKRDLALFENAKKNLERYKELAQKGYVAQIDYDNALTNYKALESTIEADKANINYLKVQLSYYYLHSPIYGKAGEILVDEGNFIKENDKIITIINQISPIHVEFGLPESKLPKILESIKAGKEMKVEIYNENGQFLDTGPITFIDNTIDKSTASFKVKVTVPNKNELLWPGQFVKVKLKLDTYKDSIVIPSLAIQKGQMKDYVWVVSDNITADIKNIDIIYEYDNLTIIKGLNAGEKVVIDGAIKLKPKSPISLKKGKNEQR
ncbi:MAG: efflux RND transporter periplasmic adaptor subunit [Calditerrivibrio sp.]|nr:efflux RND transporter periplasmic adaptor subunit [Calditerrivibrio sp.]